jgi:putative copper export protein
VEIFKILNFWVHLLSGMIWIGGILFFSIVLLPSVQNKLPKDIAGAFLRDTHVRFQKTGGIFVLLLLVTGGINIHFSHETRGLFSPKYIWVLNTKILFFTVLFTIYVLNFKNLPMIKKRAGLERIPFQDTSLVLGVLILLMAAFLKHTP